MIKAALSVLFGLANFAAFMYLATLDPTEPPKLVLTGVEPVDGFLSVIIPFFQRVVASEKAKLVTGTLLFGFIPFVFFLSIEGGRQGSKGLVRWPTLLLCLGQLIGIGNTLPLLLVPSYVTSYPSLSSPSSSSSSVSPTRTYLAILNLMVSLPLFLLHLILPPKSTSFVYLDAAFQFFPLLCIFFSFIPAPSSSSSSSSSSAQSTHRLIQLTYAVAMGISIAFYYQSWITVLVESKIIDPELSLSLDQIIARAIKFPFEGDFMNNSVQVLIVDLLGVSFSFFLILIHEQGFSKLPFYLFVYLFFSPGAAFGLYFYKREALLASASVSQQDSKKKK